MPQKPIQADELESGDVLDDITNSLSTSLPLIVDCRRHKKRVSSFISVTTVNLIVNLLVAASSTQLYGLWSIEEFLNFQFYHPLLVKKWTVLFVR